MMPDTIALVGRAPQERHKIADIPEDAAIYTIAACYDLPPRIDKCVEIHPYWVLEHERYAPPMFEWLKQPRDFPVYMQDAYPDIPGSTPYPFDEVLALAPVFRWDSGARNRLLSSSYDYLLALTILDRPKRIISVGYSMASETEYKYQREGAAFWLGLAAGLGIEIILPDECPMLHNNMIYGYEGAQAIRWERLEELKDTTAERMQAKEKEYSEMLTRLPVIESMEDADAKREELQVVGNARDEFFLYSGANQAVGELMARFTVGDIIWRQELELQRVVTANNNNTKMSLLNFWEGVVRDRQQRLHHNNGSEENRAVFLAELQEAHVKQSRARDDWMTWRGGHQVIDQLIRECDIMTDEEWQPSLDYGKMTVNTMEGEE